MIPLDTLQQGLVLAVNKPYRWTSFQAVNKVKATIRNLYNIKNFKIGHAGTLDPLATGVLLICIGRATKTIPLLQQGDKLYSGTLLLGATTPCYDLEQPISQYLPFAHISEADVRDAARRFEGEIMQVPPMFSAVKIEGQRAYTYARLDDPTAIIEPRRVQVHSFEVVSFRAGDPTFAPPPLQLPTPAASNARSPRLYDQPLQSIPAALPQVDFRIHCGKGTYVRSLVRDLGLALGSCAMLIALCREQVGEYSLTNALDLDQVADYLLHA